jgi:hypothetical protein
VTTPNRWGDHRTPATRRRIGHDVSPVTHRPQHRPVGIKDAIDELSDKYRFMSAIELILDLHFLFYINLHNHCLPPYTINFFYFLAGPAGHRQQQGYLLAGG